MADYQRLFEDALGSEVGVFGEYHALLIALGKDVCRKSPLCLGCALKLVCEYGKEEVISSKVTSYGDVKSGYYAAIRSISSHSITQFPALSFSLISHIARLRVIVPARDHRPADFPGTR